MIVNFPFGWLKGFSSSERFVFCILEERPFQLTLLLENSCGVVGHALPPDLVMGNLTLLGGSISKRCDLITLMTDLILMFTIT